MVVATGSACGLPGYAGFIRLLGAATLAARVRALRTEVRRPRCRLKSADPAGRLTGTTMGV